MPVCLQARDEEIRRVCHASAAVWCSSCLCAGFLLAGARAADEHSSHEVTPTVEQHLLAERDRLWAAAQELYGEGDVAAALKAAQRKLELERRVFGREDMKTLETIDWLATRHEEMEDFDAAIALRREAVAVTREHYGPDDWRTISVQVALRTAEQLKSLSSQERQELSDADRLNQQAIRHVREGRLREAIPLFRRVLDVRKEILGEEHLRTVSKSHSLAVLYENMGQHEEAERLFKQCLVSWGQNTPPASKLLENREFARTSRMNLGRRSVW